jgi:hypothetical protein
MRLVHRMRTNGNISKWPPKYRYVQAHLRFAVHAHCNIVLCILLETKMIRKMGTKMGISLNTAVLWNMVDINTLTTNMLGHELLHNTIDRVYHAHTLITIIYFYLPLVWYQNHADISISWDIYMPPVYTIYYYTNNYRDTVNGHN